MEFRRKPHFHNIQIILNSLSLIKRVMMQRAFLIPFLFLAIYRADLFAECSSNRPRPSDRLGRASQIGQGNVPPGQQPAATGSAPYGPPSSHPVSQQPASRPPRPSQRIADQSEVPPTAAHQVARPSQRIPGQIEVAPAAAQQVVRPSQRIPGQIEVAPAAAQQIVRPSQRIAGQSEVAPAAAQQVVRPSQRMPGQIEVAPAAAQQIVRPSQRIAGQSEVAPAAAQQVVRPSQRIPGQIEVAPAAAQQVVRPSQRIPGQIEVAPAAAQQVVRPSQRIPGQIEVAPAAAQQVVRPSQRIPGQSEVAPAAAQQVVRPSQRIPGQIEVAPAAAQQVVRPSQRIPGQIEVAPAAAQQVVRPSQRIPGQIEVAPAAAQQVVRPSQRIPGQIEVAPAAAQQIVRPSQRIAGQSEVAPAAAQQIVRPSQRIAGQSEVPSPAAQQVARPSQRIAGQSEVPSPAAQQVARPSQRIAGIFSKISRLDILVVSPLLYHSHHTLDKDVARQLAKEHNLHIFVPVREQEDCEEVENAAKAEPYTVECYWRESTRAYWEEDNGYIGGFGDFYQELFENEQLLGKLRERRFHVGLAQIHFFSVYALKLYEMLGIKKTIGMSAGSLGPKDLKLIGCLGHAMEQSVPPIGYGKYNAKMGDSHPSPERRQEIVEIYQKLSDGPGNVELMGKMVTIFVNSRPELEWNGGKFLEGTNKKLTFIGGFNLTAPKTQKQPQQRHNGGNKPTVLISFGTLVDTPTKLTDAQIMAIRDALGEFPQFHFVWKISENETRLNKHAENVEITHWIEQREKLADPNTVGFISHCGRNSQLEAIVNGVPLICVPFSVDQFYNAETMAQKGAAIGVDIHEGNFSKEKFVKAMEMLLGDMGKSKMKKTEKQQKKLLKQIEKGHRELRKNTALLQESLNASIGEMNAEMLATMAQIEKEIHALH